VRHYLHLAVISHEIPTFLKLVDVASGLQYLHILDLVHGDLKGVGMIFCQTKRLETFYSDFLGKYSSKRQPLRMSSGLWAHENPFRP